MAAYPHAIALRELCEVYNKCNFPKSEGGQKVVDDYLKAYNLVIEQSDEVITCFLERIIDLSKSKTI